MLKKRVTIEGQSILLYSLDGTYWDQNKIQLVETVARVDKIIRLGTTSSPWGESRATADRVKTMKDRIREKETVTFTPRHKYR